MKDIVQTILRIVLVALVAATLSGRAVAMDQMPVRMEMPGMSAGMKMSCCAGERHGGSSMSTACDAGCAATVAVAAHLILAGSSSTPAWNIVDTHVDGHISGPAPPPPRSV